MKYQFILLVCLVFFSCKSDPKKASKATTEGRTILTMTPEDREALITELQTRFDKDQKALSDYIYASESDAEKLNVVKKKVFKENADRMKDLFDKYGFLGWDLVGETGSHNFWLMVQHADHDTKFQYAVLKEMGPAVENNNAFAPNYAYLTDRVRLNTNKKQIYGTQVRYKENGQAVPKLLMDSLNVNVRRANIAMKPIELYLNSMTEKHFAKNKEYYLKRGVKEPVLLKVK